MTNVQHSALFLLACLCVVWQTARTEADSPIAKDAQLDSYLPSAFEELVQDDNDESSEAIDEEKRGMPGVMRFGKRAGILDVDEKRTMPGVMRFGKKAMPGVMRFGKKAMPGVMRFGKRADGDDDKRKGPAPIRFG